jgi:putative ABC transport system ATP-binding protein
MEFQLTNISKIYGNASVQTVGLQSINLKLSQRDGVVALMGTSGSGKSTLLNILGGIDSASSGSIEFRGVSLGALDQDELADYRHSQIGFIFQGFNLIPSLTAFENVLLVLQIGNQTVKLTDRSRCRELLNMVGLGDFVDVRVNRLSGGQMQRVAIARALANDPAVILADEPTANLDRFNALQVMNILKSMTEQMGKMLIIATHDPVVGDFAQRLIQMDGGTIQGEIKCAI